MKTVAIIGSGVMGSGIALCSAQSGYDTLVYDINTAALNKAQGYIGQLLDTSIQKGKSTVEQKATTLSKLTFTSNFDDLKADLILEAILEKLTLKQELFKKLEEINDTNTIFATNTSSIPITQIAATLKHPERVVGVHFFNPAHLMKLVEIIKGAATAESVAVKAFSWANSLGKTTVYAADSPGFIVNRVARHYYVEALKIMEEGVTDFDKIDTLMESIGFKMGPFRLMDLIGVDTNYSVTSSMFEQFQFDSKFRPSRIQKQKVDAGFHGRKTKKGFYNYE
jgi:3-hydroxybutyryl-CoA dehydrogenase